MAGEEQELPQDSRLIASAHLFALCAIAVAQPLFALMAEHPEYFVVNRIQPAQIYLFVAFFSLALPAGLVSLVLIAGLRSRRWRRVSQSVLVGVLIALVALQMVKRLSLPGAVCIAVSAAIGALGAVLYRRSPNAGFLLTMLSPAILVIPALFIYSGDVQRLLHPDPSLPTMEAGAGASWVTSRPPIIMVVFDEFALVDLLDAEGSVDSKRYPNFAEFADQATWYANATTVHHATSRAVPSILTGKWPQQQGLSRFQEYPRNLFSLLQAHYALNVIEPVTQLLPESSLDQVGQVLLDEGSRGAHLRMFGSDMAIVLLHVVLPEVHTRRLPSIGAQWGGFLDPAIQEAGEEKMVAAPTLTRKEKKERVTEQERLARRRLRDDRKVGFESFVSRLDEYPPETLHFLHIFLPHRPAKYLPGGQTYTTEPKVRGVYEDAKTKGWVGDQRLVDKLHHRHRLQLGFVDGLLGKLLARLEEIGLYEDSLVILVADHGMSYISGVSNRRPSPENYGELAFVPLFIKYPRQKEGARDDSNVELIDILPTIVDVLDAKVNWEFDGRSLVDGQAAPRSRKRLPTTYGEILEYDAEEYLAAKERALQRNREVFALADARSDHFRTAESLELAGTEAAELATLAVPCPVKSSGVEELGDVDASTAFLPTHLTGELDCPELDPEGLLLAVVVNGVLEVASRPYSFEDETLFDVVLPTAALRDGTNRVELLVVRRTAAERLQGVEAGSVGVSGK